jgi:hypothetical protein
VLPIPGIKERKPDMKYTMGVITMGLLCAVACSAFAQPSAPQKAPAGNYVDLGSSLQSDADIDAWYGFTYRLRDDFDQICGDTFCEGDYSNIESLRFVCSADAASGEVGQCVWSFAASDEQVDPRRGRVSASIPSWRCVSPLAPHTRVRELLAALAVEHPLHAPLPHTTTSLYDGLVDCL